MKNYIKLLWIKYHMRIIGVGVLLSIILAVLVYYSLESRLNNFNEVRAFAYIHKENPELVEEYRESFLTTEEPDQDTIGKRQNFQNKVNKLKEELNSSKKAITENDIIEMKSSFKKNEKYLDGMGSIYESFVIQLEDKEKREFGLYDGSGLDSSVLISEMSLKSNKVHFGLLSLGVITAIMFSVFLVGNITSLESMTRYKYFDESIPISKPNKYLGKTIFAILSVMAFWLIQVLIAVIIEKMSPYSGVIDMNGPIVGAFMIMIVLAGISSIFVFIGSYCGNIISYLGSVVFMLLGAPMLSASLTMMLGLFLPESISGRAMPGIISMSERIYNFLPTLKLMDPDSIDFVLTLKFIVIVLLIIMLGRFISKHIKTERSGMFYNNEIIDKIYYVLFTAFTALNPVIVVKAVLLEGESSNQNIIINIIVYIVFIAVLGRLYRYFFNAKLSI